MAERHSLPAAAAGEKSNPENANCRRGHEQRLARIVYHLMRYGMAYVRQTEEAYAAQVRDRLEKQLQRRAKELGYELKKIEPKLETVIVNCEELTVKADGEIVAAK